MMKRPIFILLTIVSVSVNCLESTENCNLSPFAKCTSPKGIDVTEFGTFLPDETFLNENCGAVLVYLQCFVDYENICPIEKYIGTTLLGVAPIRKIANQICTADSILRKSYLEVMECVKTNKDFVKGFKNLNNMFMEFQKMHLGDRNIQKNNRIMGCIREKYFLPELQQTLELFCSADLTEVIADTWHLVYGPETRTCPPDDKEIEAYIEFFENLRNQLGYESQIPQKYSPKNKAINDQVIKAYIELHENLRNQLGNKSQIPQTYAPNIKAINDQEIEAYTELYEYRRNQSGDKSQILQKYAIKNEAINDHSQHSLFFLFVFLFMNYFGRELFS